jgi:hypothetical protein
MDQVKLITQSEDELKVKKDDILERQGLVFIWYKKGYSGITKETKRIFMFPQK